MYDEQLTIATPNVTVRGESRNDTVIDGGGLRPFGIVATADGVIIEHLTVTGATFYGVLATGLHDENGPSAPTTDGYESWDPTDFPPLERFLIDHVTAYNNGLYGIYAFNSRHGVIRDSYASGSADSGFYVGQCTECDILVTGNVAERNAAGFENSNASDSVVVAGNRFTGNNEAASPAHANGAFGIGISGGQDNVIAHNRIGDNARAGIVLANAEDLPARGNRAPTNVFESNGVDASNTSAARTPAADNCVEGSISTAPAELAAQLAAACSSASVNQATASELDTPAAPRGLSFKKVAAPRDQPDSPTSTCEAVLPQTVEMPDLALLGVPPSDFLADLTVTRPFETHVQERGVDLHLQEWVDYVAEQAYASTTGDFNAQALVWTASEVGIAAQYPDADGNPLLPAPTLDDPLMTVDVLTPTSSRLDTLLTVISNLGADRPDNPLLLQQSGALWLRDGTPVTVFAAPPDDSPRDESSSALTGGSGGHRTHGNAPHRSGVWAHPHQPTRAAVWHRGDGRSATQSSAGSRVREPHSQEGLARTQSISLQHPMAANH